VVKDQEAWRASAASGADPDDSAPPGDATATLQDGALGRTIKGRYRLVRLLGRGATGNVYEALHLGLGSTFALKQLRADFDQEPSVVARFRHEASTMAQLRHPNIVRVFDVDFEPEFGTWMAMELIHGEHLGARMRREGRLPLADVLRIGGEVAAALDCAHRAGLVHRDIKPANVLLEADGGRAVLTDFGIAKSLHGERADAPTRPGVYLGTYRYSSPEQIRARPGVEVDARADVYSLGVVLYEMISGKRFLAGRSENEIVGEVGFRTDWQPPLAYDAPPPAALAALIAQCTMPDRSRRLQSAEEVAARLAACAGDASPPVPPASDATSPGVPASSGAVVAPRRRRLLLATSLGLLVLVLGAFAYVQLAPPSWPVPFADDTAAHILSYTPDDELVVVAHATTQWFSVVLEGFDPDHPPRLRWLLDGTVVAQGTTTWEYDPRTYHASAVVPQELRFVIGSGRGEQQSQAWRVKVAASDLSPVLRNASYKPGSKIEVPRGSTVVVKVDAYDPDGDALTFSWRLDGHPLGGNAAEVTVPVDGDHQLSLAISDGEAAVSSSWQIVATPPGG
jgi:serine/threonine protein kinase